MPNRHPQRVIPRLPTDEMGYCHAVTLDGLLGKINATSRAANRTVGALAGGIAVALAGERATLLGVAVVLAVAFAIAAFSSLRAL